MNFHTALHARWQQAQTLLCVGLDPDCARLPAGIAATPEGVLEFCTRIVDATAEFACAFKPQIAAFAALRADAALEALIAHIHRAHAGIPVVLDAKRGDIGNTARWYAEEAFGRFGADAVTVNPYMGGDTLAPWLEYRDKGVFVLCRTSNPGAGQLQDLTLADGAHLYEHVARLAAREWNAHGNCGLVVGATRPHELARVRESVGADMPLLVPGVGAQGGDLAATLAAGRTQTGGLLINASRAILYASDGADYAQAAHNAARALRDAMRT